MTDYAAHMREIIDQHTGLGPYSAPVAATEIAAKLRQTDPELLRGWLDAQAERFIWQAINDRDRSRRSHAVHSAKSSVFRSALSEHLQQGTTAPIRAFLDAPYTVADGTRRRLGALGQDDLNYVADRYDDRARQNGLYAAFLRAIARKVKTGTVDDHFTEEQIAAMWESLSD